MLNHPDVIWRYADILARQAEMEGRRRANLALISALASPASNRRQLRILGFRDR